MIFEAKLFKCNYCGFVWTCNYIFRCHNCNSANIILLPFSYFKRVPLKEFNKYGIKILKTKPHFNNKYVNENGVGNMENVVENKEQVREINITGRFYTVNIVSNNDEETVDFLIDKALTVLDTIKRRDY